MFDVPKKPSFSADSSSSGSASDEHMIENIRITAQEIPPPPAISSRQEDSNETVETEDVEEPHINVLIPLKYKINAKNINGVRS